MVFYLRNEGVEKLKAQGFWKCLKCGHIWLSDPYANPVRKCPKCKQIAFDETGVHISRHDPLNPDINEKLKKQWNYTHICSACGEQNCYFVSEAVESIKNFPALNKVCESHPKITINSLKELTEKDKLRLKVLFGEK